MTSYAPSRGRRVHHRLADGSIACRLSVRRFMSMDLTSTRGWASVTCRRRGCLR